MRPAPPRHLGPETPGGDDMQYNVVATRGVGIFSIDPVEIIAGSLPRRQMRLVEAWAELHQNELAADWETLQQGRAPLPIEPLK
jgi:hypothetical protein